MIYLSHFEFPSSEVEYDFIFHQKHTCYNTYYPFQILSKHGFCRIDFEPVTILYGGNGSGKTTALNVIAEKLGLQRDALYNRSNFFEDYIRRCCFETAEKIPKHSAIITSDDVFDFMLNLRSLNEGIDRRREELFEDYSGNIPTVKALFYILLKRFRKMVYTFWTNQRTACLPKNNRNFFDF